MVNVSRELKSTPRLSAGPGGPVPGTQLVPLHSVRYEVNNEVIVGAALHSYHNKNLSEVTVKPYIVGYAWCTKSAYLPHLVGVATYRT